jgi:hypothetical protein
MHGSTASGRTGAAAAAAAAKPSHLTKHRRQAGGVRHAAAACERRSRPSRGVEMERRRRGALRPRKCGSCGPPQQRTHGRRACAAARVTRGRGGALLISPQPLPGNDAARLA